MARKKRKPKKPKYPVGATGMRRRGFIAVQVWLSHEQVLQITEAGNVIFQKPVSRAVFVKHAIKRLIDAALRPPGGNQKG